MNRDSYNKIAQIWAQDRNESFVSQLIMDFSGSLKPNARILDVGCGTGKPVASFLAHQGFHVTGIDIAENMIELATSYSIPNCEFFVCDFFDFEPEMKFDGIIAWDSLFHFPKSKQESIYPILAEMLVPGGLLLFTHGDADDEHTSPMMGEEFYYSAITRQRIKKLLKENDFEIDFISKDFKEQDTDRGLVVGARKRG